MIIGISGKKGSGKNTVSALINTYAYGFFEEKQFASTIKAMVSVLIHCEGEDLEDQDFKNTPVSWLDKTPRFLLQTLGTEWGRDLVDKDVWVKSLLSSYTNEQDWIITDVRFPNECSEIKKLGGKLVRVERTHFNDTHPSETALDGYNDWDYIINNNGSLGDLDKKISAMCQTMGL